MQGPCFPVRTHPSPCDSFAGGALGAGRAGGRPQSGAGGRPAWSQQAGPEDLTGSAHEKLSLPFHPGHLHPQTGSCSSQKFNIYPTIT